jgi:hypothetical protein
VLFRSLTDSLQQLPEIRDVTVTWSNLGGIPSIFLHVSLDDRSEWINGIFYNSRYSIFAIHSDMKLDQISRHCSLPKHRKCKIDSIQGITAKVQKWASSSSQCKSWFQV